MDNTQSFLFFLISILWAVSLNSYSRYKPFDTSAFWCNNKWKFAVRRFIVSFFVINLTPLVLIITLSSIFSNPTFIIDKWNVKVGLFLSCLSVFGIVRIYHSIIFASKYRSHFYHIDDIKKIENANESEMNYNFWAHFIPGMVFMFIFPVIGYLLAKI